MAMTAESISEEVPQSVPVELATLIIPAAAFDTGISSCNGNEGRNEVVLQACQETCDSINVSNAATIVPGSIPGIDTACIQAVVDLEKLSVLVGTSEDELVTGLHREANEESFCPDSKLNSSDGGIGLNEIRHPTGEEQSLLPPCHKRQDTCDTQITLDASAFTEAFSDLLPSKTVDVTTSEDNTQLGLDAFLLEIPQPGETNQTFVLALPEIQAPDEEMSIVSEEFLFPLLEKAWSIMPTQLPTDVEDVQIEASSVPVNTGNNKDEQGDHQVASELHLDVVVKRRVPVIGYIILFTGLVALSSVGTALDLQGEAVTPSMKTFWRLTATSLALLPFTINVVQRDGLPKLSLRQWCLFSVAAFSYSYMVMAFVIALSMTSLTNTFVLSNFTSLVIIVGKAILGLPILKAEGSGAVIGFMGGAVCAGSISSQSSGAAAYPQGLLGDLIAFSASFGTAAYLIIAKDLRSSVDLYVFMFVIMALSSVYVFVFMVVSGETVMLSNDPYHGLWGWTNLNTDRLPLELYIVVVCNLIGTMGYIAVLKYFDSVVISTVMLLEPVFAAFIGVMMRVDSLPGVQTWIGDIIVTIGSLLVIWSGARKTESIDATKAVRLCSNTKDFTCPPLAEFENSPYVMKSPVCPKKEYV